MLSIDSVHVWPLRCKFNEAICYHAAVFSSAFVDILSKSQVYCATTCASISSCADYTGGNQNKLCKVVQNSKPLPDYKQILYKAY